jgi:hypothetical protein
MNWIHLICAAGLLLAVPGASAAGVLINEIMYHPSSGNPKESYVELHNTGPASVNISGWRFTEGFAYTLPANTWLGAGAYLVIAADGDAFSAKHPGTLNVLAGWPAPMKSHLRLENTQGQAVSEVNFSNEGDWATRVLTNTGFASYGHWGWLWHAPHDGGGSSLELINSGLPNTFAHNWTSSSTTDGTPGKPNSVASVNVPPLVTSVAHSPALPRPTDVVTVTARLTDEKTNGISATLFYREASSPAPPPFMSMPMFDDGAHGDGLASDGIFAAILPGQPLGTIIEFYLEAKDAENNTRTYPAVIPPLSSARTANLLYQVDNESYGGSQPIYRMIMTEMERAELYQIGSGCAGGMDSDAEMNATWISIDGIASSGSSTEIRYNIGVRNRGHGSRSARPNNYHVNIPEDHSWRGVAGVNLNSQYAHSQVVGSALSRAAGLPMPQSRPVQLRVNGTNLMKVLPGTSFGSYAANEQYNSDFVERSCALDPRGNSYRGIRSATSCDPSLSSVADLTWHGADYAIATYTNAYFKQNNLLENDWTDLIDLLAVLNSENGYDTANYAADVQRRVDVDQWMRYMALNTLFDTTETCLANGYGDDYGMFRGTNDTRFLLLPYDLDSILGRGLTSSSPRNSIFRMTSLPVIDRFMKTPQFAPRHYHALKTLAETTFAPGRLNPMLDQLLAGYIPQANIDKFKAFTTDQRSHVLSQIPLSLTVSNTLTGTPPRTTSPTAALSGAANAIETRSVLVNGAAAEWTAWRATWRAPEVPLQPGVNRICVQSLDQNGVEFERAYCDIWYDDGSVQNVGGSVAANVTWTAANGPYRIGSSLTIPDGVTLTIEPGTTVYLAPAVDLLVANGGRLLAEGSAAAPIRFTTQPGVNGAWGGITINGVGASPETRFAYVAFEGNSTNCIQVYGGSLYLEHSTFLSTSNPYVSLDGASFLISHCHFPAPSRDFEPLHGLNGIRAGGRGIIRNSFFGATMGYSDILDFTGGNRDLNEPILQFINNVAAGSTDDILDLDGADAWVEGNIFMHVHRNGPPDSSSAISGGNYGAQLSEVTILGNIFYDCDQAATAKNRNFFTMLNNTIVRTTKTGGQDTDSGVINVLDFEPVPGNFAAGFYLEGNIIEDASQLVRNYEPTMTSVVLNNNVLPVAWTGPGSSNVVSTPLLTYIPRLEETFFTNWHQAQILREWFAPLPGSPAHGTGPNGRDVGGVIQIGASISGEPAGTNNQTSAALTVGSVRSGLNIPSPGWPSGSGYTHYRWRLDDNPSWSAETPTTAPITLTGLANGQHHVEVIGKRDSGWYQDAAEFGDDGMVTRSRTWTVDTSFVPQLRPSVRLNEILAQNSSTFTNAGTTPDMVELHNYGKEPVVLAGMGISDNTNAPYKFTFPVGTPNLAPGQHLTLYGDNQNGAPGTHLGFGLKANGDDLYLCESASRGGALLDWVRFGIQLADHSVGRGPDGVWVLCKPTFGSANVPVQLADPHVLKINEWLADSLFVANHDFIELFNPASLPVHLGECYLSDAEGALARFRIPALSFIASSGYASFAADSDPEQGPDHLNFKLDPNVGIILLSDGDLRPIDAVTYGPQRTDIAQGRTPSGSDTVADFSLPTAGGPNPVPNVSTITNITAEIVTLLDMNKAWSYDTSGGASFGDQWHQTNYNDSAWPTNYPLFGTSLANYPYPFRTEIAAPATGGKIAVYYRTHFPWNGALTNYVLVSTNYVDDGAVYYLNGTRVGSLRMPESVTFNTTAANQSNEGIPEILVFTNKPVIGDNVMAVEVHQTSAYSGDHAFGMQLNAVRHSTNILSQGAVALPVVLNEILASNHSVTNADGSLADWVELYNPTTNSLDISNASLSNDPDSPRKFVFAQGTVIPALDFLLIYCNNDLPQSTTNTGFSLNATTDAVYLFGSPATGGGLVDAVSFGLQASDFSIGRIPNGVGPWVLNVPTPKKPNNSAALGSAADLSINEWMADPVTGSDWFELFNKGQLPIALRGLAFTDDATRPTLSPIPPLSFIGTGASRFIKLLADDDLDAGADHVNFKLSRAGDIIGLYSLSGTLVTSARFGEQLTGISEGRFPDGSDNVTPFHTTTSAGESNYLPLTNVVVNEILTHTDPPYEDALEFYNPTLGTVQLAGWFISNSADDLKKYRIGGGSVPGRSFAAFYEYQFNSVGGTSVPFEFNSAHDGRVFLSEADANGNLTGYRAVANFGAAANGRPFIRHTNSIGEVHYVAAASPTFGINNPLSVQQFRSGSGAANPGPLIGPVVINEIMFYPPLLGGVEDNTLDEYVELFNVSNSTISLFDPLAPTNSWKLKGGVDFTFPPHTTLLAGGFLLVVNFDPVADAVSLAQFRAYYNLPASVPLYGPYGGNLANSGETVSLYMPDPPQKFPQPDAGFVPYVLADRVSFLDVPPWPTGAAGTGSSLQRQTATLYGNDPANWIAADPRPGRSNSVDPADVNGDGLPDTWQNLYFASYTVPEAAPGADPDNDGFNNLQEYVTGTHPLRADSCLKLEAVDVSTGRATIRFTGVAGHTYTVLYADNPATGPWLRLANIPAQPTTGPLSVPDTASPGASSRCYRLATPQLP